jgi:orotate phosphoribosyltransferase-like protein
MRLEKERLNPVIARRKTALAYRQEGMTYKQIGKILEVSKERARQIVLLAERDVGKVINRYEVKEEIDWEFYRFYGMKFNTLKFYCESLAERKDCDECAR